MGFGVFSKITPAILVGDGRKQIAVLDGSDAEISVLPAYIDQLKEQLLRNGNSVTHLPLRTMVIAQCRGCWNCWTRTPGECAIDDDGPFVCRQVIKADWIILASPLIMGFPSARLKTVHDRLLPLIHPYLSVIGGEIHHRPRYPRFPRLALLLETEADTDSEDLAIVREIYRRDAINFHTTLAAFWTTGHHPEEVSHEIDAI